MDKLAKAMEAEAIGGVSASELLAQLSARGVIDTPILADPATMGANDALAFANRLCELDRADVIFVILQRLKAYEAEANRKATATAPAPCLDALPAPVK